MLLYAASGEVKLGQIVRYIISYTPPKKSSSSSIDSKNQNVLKLTVTNKEMLPLRAAYLNGPFIIYVDARPDGYSETKKVTDPVNEPFFEPDIKAGGKFSANLHLDGTGRTHTWTVDVVSQILFSNGVRVTFDISLTTATPGDSNNDKALMAKALKENMPYLNSSVHVIRKDTFDIWNTPAIPHNEDTHLVVLTHGLFSNTSADMLYLKEKIDKAAETTGENVVVRGFFHNAGHTEKGIKYLGTRVGRYIATTLRYPSVKKISFIGHSLGGLVQTYAIAYIQAHYPDFFTKIEPINFICLTSPLLGVTNENPGYVKMGLDMGVMGKTGQDIGLSWRPGQKPLLEILPSSPAHEVLVKFKRRTLYANCINDGIVPLRTSCLLYLDWKGLARAREARHRQPHRAFKSDKDENPDPKSPAPVSKGSEGLSNSSGSESSAQSDSGLLSREDHHSNHEHNKKSKHSPTCLPSCLSPRTSLDGKSSENGDENAHSGSRVAEEAEDVQQTTGKESESTLSYFVRPLKSLFTVLNAPGSSRHRSKIMRATQTITGGGDSKPKGAQGKGEDTNSRELEGDAIPTTSLIEAASSVMNPPAPKQEFLLDPAKRPTIIIHDRIYHPEDIPPPRKKKRSTFTFNGVKEVEKDTSKIEEKLARQWHKDMSWRKVLVELEPDAHNNIIVRRRFANAYGWPVIEHLVDNHFLHPYSDKRRDSEAVKEDAIQYTDVEGYRQSLECNEGYNNETNDDPLQTLATPRQHRRSDDAAEQSESDAEEDTTSEAGSPFLRSSTKYQKPYDGLFELDDTDIDRHAAPPDDIGVTHEMSSTTTKTKQPPKGVSSATTTGIGASQQQSNHPLLPVSKGSATSSDIGDIGQQSAPPPSSSVGGDGSNVVTDMANYFQGIGLLPKDEPPLGSDTVEDRIAEQQATSTFI